MTAKLMELVSTAVIMAAKAHIRAAGERLAEVGLQAGQDVLLSRLWEQDGLSQSEILERIHVEAPTLTKTVSRLEKNGIVTRKRDSKDTRVSRVYLTARGKKLEAPVRRIWADLEARATDGMTDDERRTLEALSRRMRANHQR